MEDEASGQRVDERDGSGDGRPRVPNGDLVEGVGAGHEG